MILVFGPTLALTLAGPQHPSVCQPVTGLSDLKD